MKNVNSKEIVFKILVINDEQLLSAAILSLLQSENDWELISYTPQCMADIIQKTEQIQPNVIVLNQNNECLSSIHHLLMQLAEHNVSLIVVSNESNWLNIYSTRFVLLDQVNDLITMIYTLGQYV